MKIAPHLRDMIGAVAPSLGKALGGPLAGVAMREIAHILLGNGEASEDDVAQALEHANATDLVTLREIDATFAQRMEQLGVELDRIAAQDRADARARQVSTGDWTPAVLAAVIIAGFFALIGALMFRSVPQGSDEIVYIMVGILGGMASQVANFFFGSSAGSKSKTDVIARLKEATGRSVAPPVPKGFGSGGLY